MWNTDKNELYKKFEFADFNQAMQFVSKVANVAEGQNHHPNINVAYNIVELRLSTHEKNTVTEKDHALAGLIDKINHELDEPDHRTNDDQPSREKSALKFAKMYSDGGSRGNPGPSAYGYVLFTHDDEVISEGAEYLGITTNNQAEYQSLKHGIEDALKQGVQELDVYMDSMLVINQMKGIYKVKNRDLWPIYNDIKTKAEKFKKITFAHVPRENNKHADALVNKALDDTLIERAG